MALGYWQETSLRLWTHFLLLGLEAFVLLRTDGPWGLAQTNDVEMKTLHRGQIRDCSVIEGLASGRAHQRAILGPFGNAPIANGERTSNLGRMWDSSGRTE